MGEGARAGEGARVIGPTDEAPPPAPGQERRALQGLALLAFLVPLLACCYTGHVWEDFFITFRYSENFAHGAGLTHHDGERVHGFTSPFGVLLPALGSVLGREGSWLTALWTLRLFCLAAFAGAACVAVRASRREPGSTPAAAVLFAALLLVEAKSVTFTTSGMETALMLLFLALGLDASRRGVAGGAWRGGLAWAGLMWTRPDACFAVAGLGVVELAFGPDERRATLALIGRQAAICTIMYLPWFLCAWSYYGSPVPHTVLAKANTSQLGFLAGNLGTAIAQRWARTFAPPYAGIGGWPDAVQGFSFALSAVAALYWLVPGPDRFGRGASLLFALLQGYLLLVPMPYPWYYPPVAFAGLVAVSRATFGLVPSASGRAADVVRGVAATLLVVASAALLVAVAFELRVQQREIEEGNRMAIGRYLATRVAPRETVFLEPLGYIGYFSRARVLDWPGLATPSVRRLHQERGLDMAGVAAELRPDWLVLRPAEASQLFQHAELRDAYVLERAFDARARLAAHPFLPGREWLAIDAVFGVFRRLR